MRWTPENDQLLLVTLLETHQINVKGDIISKAWPQDGRDVPTARAITERIVKIRALSKNSMESSPLMKQNGAAAAASIAEASSPSKKKRGPRTPKTPKGAAAKNAYDDEELPSPSKKPKVESMDVKMRSKKDAEEAKKTQTAMVKRIVGVGSETDSTD